MSALGGRATRSRYSSPHISAAKDSPKDSADRNTESKTKRSTLDTWLEPQLAAPRPSFAEAGIERHGVLTNMAPLGTMPTSKIIKGASLKAGNQDAASRRSRRETSVASTPAESLDNPTPEPTQTPELVEIPGVSVQGDLEPVAEDNMDIDRSVGVLDPALAALSEEASVAKPEQLYALQQPPQPQLPFANESHMNFITQSPGTNNGTHGGYVPQPSAESFLAGQPFTMGNFGPPGFGTQPGPFSTYHNNLMQSGSYVLPLPPLGPDNEFLTNLDRTDAVIEHAVQAALDDGKLPTAYALRTLYDDQREQTPAVRIIEAVYGGFANPEQRQEFLAQVTQRKKLGKKDRRAEYYFNGDGNDFLIRPRRSSLLSTAGLPFWSSAFSTPTYQPQHAPPKYQTPYSPLPVSGPSVASAEVIEKSSPPPQPTSISSPKVAHDVDNDEPPSKKLKIESVTASGAEKQIEMSTDTNQAISSHMNGTAPSKSKSPEAREKRSGSLSSNSSLSSVNEDVLLSTSTFNSPEKQQRHATPPVNNPPEPFGGGVNTSFAMHENPVYASLYFNGGKFISPYASKENFEKVAQTLSGPPSTIGGFPVVQSQVKAAPKPGPKTFLFSIHKPTSASTPSAPVSSPAINVPPNSSETQPSSKNNTRAKTSMAPTANATSSSSTTTTTTPSSNPPTKAVFRTKGQSRVKEQTPPVLYDANDKTSRMKRKARDTTNRNNVESVESFVRDTVLPSHDIEIDSDVESVTSRPAKKPTKIRFNTKSRNVNDESDDNSSPTVLSFQPDLAPGSLPTSRAATPNNTSRSSRKAKSGSGLRVKTSPMKKKGGILAGLSRPSGERSSPTSGQNGAQQEDNDDYCSSCGGNGGLVCCDGCTRSFHYQCVDPPMIESALPDDPWFCNVCQSSRQPPPPDSESRGAFGDLLVRLSERNPSAFQLPQDIRDYFDGVRTGGEGEYEDVVPPKTRANRPGWEEQPDYFRTRDAKGALILCYLCKSTASAPDRKIIPCTFCPNYWHLDCVPNPLAKEPGNGRQWRCPLHVDDVLSNLPSILAPAHRLRKIKGAVPVYPTISRGNKNNGQIEIENEASEDEEALQDIERYGKIYKVTDKDVKLDFLSKVKENGRSLSTLLSQRKGISTAQKMSRHSIVEQQAALNLATLASQAPSTDDRTGELIHALLNGAPQAAIALIAQGDGASPSNVEDRNMLLMVRELINKKLGMTGDSAQKSDDGDEPNVNTPPSSIVLKPENINVSVPDDLRTSSQQGDDSEILIT